MNDATTRSAGSQPTWPAAVGLGIAAGGLAGLFGVGGGILIVPGLVLLLKFEQRLAHGTSLVAIVPMALAGVVGFALNDSVDWVVAGCLVIGSSAGAVAGTRVLRRLQGPTLTYLFVAVMLVAAVRLLFGEVDTSGRDGLDAAMAVGLVALGLVAGFLAGLLGVGGGVVMVPGQILLFGIADAVAKGTSLAVILPTALVATWRNLRHDNADVRVGATVGVAGMLAAFAAAQVSVRLDPGVSTTLFGIFLLIVAARMALTARREARARAT